MASSCPEHIETLSYGADCIKRSIYLIVRLKGLEQSRHLNGLTGQIIGYTGMMEVDDRIERVVDELVSEKDFRYHVLLNLSSNRKKISVKIKNLEIVRQTLDTPIMSDREVMEHIRELLLRLKTGTPDIRKDINMRQNVYRDALKYYDETSEFPNELLSTLACTDLSIGNRIPLSDFDSLMKHLRSIKPVCQGNGFVDFHAFSLGLLADGENICSICLDTPMRAEPVSLLPCGHVFHQICIDQYEKTHVAAGGRNGLSCPNCKKAIVSESWTHHRKPTKERIRDRFGEFLLSGFCVYCIIHMIESQQIYEKYLGLDTKTGNPIYGHFAGSRSNSIQETCVGPSGVHSLLLEEDSNDTAEEDKDLRN